MNTISICLTAALFLPGLTLSAEYNLGELAEANKLELFNRISDPTKADSPQAVFLELLNERPGGQIGIWVGNGSDGWFRNLKVSPAPK